jgi:hypothetical protein
MLISEKYQYLSTMAKKQSLTKLLEEGKVPERIEIFPGVFLKHVLIEDLKPNTWNPNEMPEDTFDFLVSRIKKVGFRDPILTLADGTIIDGEHRWRALKEVGTEDTWVMEVEDDILTAREETINMNLIKGDFNPIKLGKLVASLVSESSLEEVANNIVIDSYEMEAMIELVQDLKDAPGLPDDYSPALPKFSIDIIFTDPVEYRAVSAEWGTYKERSELNDNRLAFKKLLSSYRSEE